MARLASLLRAATEAGALLAGVHDEPEIYRAVCDVAVRDLRCGLAWVGLAEPGTRAIRVQTASGGPRGFLAESGIGAGRSIQANPAIGRSVASGTSEVISELAAVRGDPSAALAAAHGLRSMAAVPLRTGRLVVGVVACYSKEPAAFGVEEIAILETLCSQATTRLAALEKEQRRREAQQAVAQTEERYRLLFEAAPLGLLVAGSDGVEVNDSLLAMFGFADRDEFGERRLEELVDPECRDDVAAFRESLVADDRAPTIIRTRGLRSDGTTFPLLVDGAQMAVGDGANGVYFLTDLGPMETAETLARTARGQYRALVESAPLPIVSVDLEGVVRSWNPAAERVFGWAAAEVMGRPFPGAFSPRDREYLEHVASGAESPGQPREVRLRRRDGRSIDLRLRVSPVLDAEGRTADLLVLAEDVTTEHRLAAERARLVTAIEQTVELVLITDLHANIVYVNPAFERLTGYSRAEVLGKNPRLLQSGEQPAEFYRELWQTLGAGQTWSGNFVNRRKDGPLFATEATISPIRGEHGSISGFVAVERDVTFQRAEQAAHKAADRSYKSLFDNMREGLAYHRMIWEDGRPVDYEFLSANPAFGELTGLRGVIGKRVGEVIPGIRDADPELFERYGRVAAGGPPETFRTYVASLDQWFSISAYCPEPGYFAAIFQDVSEQERATRDLRDQQALLQSVVNATTDAIYVKDPRGRYLLVNDAVARVAGKPPGEILGRDDTAIFDAATARAVMVNDQKILAGSEPVTFEERGDVDGVENWFVSTKGPLFGPDGERLGLFGFSRNITERKRSGRIDDARARLLDLSLAFSLDELLAATLTEAEDLTGSRIGFYHFVADDQRTLAMSQWSPRTKASCDVLTAGTHDPLDEAGVWTDCVETRAPVIHNDYAALSNKRGLPEGHATLIRELVVPILRGDRIRAIVGVGNKPTDYVESDVEAVSRLADLAFDIAERKRAEDELRQSEAKFAAAFHAAPILMSIVDLETGKYVDVNDAGCAISGFSRDEMIGRTAVELGWAPRERQDEILADIARSGRMDGVLVAHKRKDGAEVEILTYGDRITIGGRECLLTTGIDLTERNLLDRELGEARLHQKAIFDGTPDLIWSVEPTEFRLTSFNRAFAEYLSGQRGTPITDVWVGMSQEELLRQPDVRETWAAFYRRALAEGSFQAEYRGWGGARSFQLSVHVLIRGDAVFSISVFARDMTDWFAAQEQLRASEEKFSLAFRSAPLLSSIRDLETGEILDASDQLLRLVGTSRGEMASGHPDNLDWIGPEDLAYLTSEVKAGRNIRGRETTRQAPDGTTVVLLLFADGITIGGRPCVLSTAVDITDRKRLERELAESQVLQTTVADSTRDWIWAVDGKSFGLTWWNRSFGDHIVHTRGRVPMAGMTPRELFLQPEEQAAWIGRFKRAVEAGWLRMEYESAGRTLLLAFHALRRGGDSPESPGEVFGVSVFGRDITEARRAETELRDSEERFRAMSESSLSGIAIIDDGRIRYVNTALANILGYERDELIGMDVLQTIAPEDREAISSEIRRRQQGIVRAAAVEARAIRKDGEVRYLLIFGSTVDLGGRRVVMTNVLDMTDRRRLEDDLRQSQKLEALGRLAGGVAHDFNNLLTAIGGYARLIKDDLENGAGDPADATRIIEAADRAAAMTSRLLAFSGRQKKSPLPIDVSDAVRQILPIMRRVVPERIELATSLSATPSVLADTTELDQVLLNLVVNAADAIKGAGRIEIGAALVDHDADFIRHNPAANAGPHVRLTVSDNGDGMDEATLSRIYEPFFTTKPKGTGTGLGLAIVYGIVEGMGGVIDVTSAPGAGTAFRIDLPISGEVSGVHAEATRQVMGGDERVLLVEDERMVLTLSEMILRRLGYRVTAVADPREALKLDPSSFDLIVTDVIMPVMDGPEMARRIRASRPDMPVLYVSGYQPVGEMSVALREPRTSLLAKPFTWSSLAGAVRAALEGPSDPDDAESADKR